jgi:acyl carrier protein
MAALGRCLLNRQHLTGNRLEVIDDVKSIIAKSLKIPIERLTPDARLEELGAESLDVIEIVFDLEEKFNITIPFKPDESTRLTMQDDGGGEVVQFSTVGDLANVVQKLVQAQTSR